MVFQLATLNVRMSTPTATVTRMIEEIKFGTEIADSEFVIAVKTQAENQALDISMKLIGIGAF